jgi:hypothetical protein
MLENVSLLTVDPVDSVEAEQPSIVASVKDQSPAAVKELDKDPSLPCEATLVEPFLLCNH